MIKCTLQEAIELCEENGGRFHVKGYNGLDRDWGVDTSGQIRNIQHDLPFELTVKSLSAEWIYEPPKQSAFQKWSKEQPARPAEPSFKSSLLRAEKEGWNGALDEVLGIITTYDGALKEMVKKLKEG